MCLQSTEYSGTYYIILFKSKFDSIKYKVQHIRLNQAFYWIKLKELFYSITYWYPNQSILHLDMNLFLLA